MTDTGVLQPLKTWSHLAGRRRKPSEYEIVSTNLLYNTRPDAPPYEVDPNVFMNRWYIEHRDGSVARYAHLARINPDIRPGAVVLPGEPVATLGRTGRTTGPHLHIELRRHGRAVDPWPWLTRTACLADTEVAEAPR